MVRLQQTKYSLDIILVWLVYFDFIHNRCQCGQCVSMATAEEQRCCLTYHKVRQRLSSTASVRCISQHQGFIDNCLLEAVLEADLNRMLEETGPVDDRYHQDEYVLLTQHSSLFWIIDRCSLKTSGFVEYKLGHHASHCLIIPCYKLCWQNFLLTLNSNMMSNLFIAGFTDILLTGGLPIGFTAALDEETAGLFQLAV